MVTTTIYVKPYLAAYMYVRYQNSVVTELNAIRLKVSKTCIMSSKTSQLNVHETYHGGKPGI